jgi:hypothetical protein
MNWRLPVCSLAASALLIAQQPADSVAPRSTTERPNLSAPGMQQTLTGVLMDATCGAIADSRSELTKTPRLVSPTERRASEARSTEPASSSAAPSVPETYRDCKVKTSSTSFALYSDGRVYMLDRISNQMMQEHMAKAPARRGSAWQTVTLVGSATSDDVLTLRSIRK